VKRIAEALFRETLAAIHISAAIERKLSRTGSRIQVGSAIVDLREFREIVVIALGKAAFPMARAVVDILSPEFQPEGILVVPDAPGHELPGFTIFLGGHPAPNSASFEAGRAILQRLSRCHEKSLIFFLVSGGGSSLVEQTLDGAISLEDFQQLNAALTKCGAPIEQINAVRKHLSAIKGGRMATAVPQAMKITLALSDVPRGRESAIASGPTLPDPATVSDVARVISEYDLREKLPISIRGKIDRQELEETPKHGHPAFLRAHFEVLLSTHDLLHAAHLVCEGGGFSSICDDTTDGWPIDRAASHLLAHLDAHKRMNPGRPVAVLAGGEVSSPVTGPGIGGRNSAFVLACVSRIAGAKITVLSAGTDGIDGNSPAAGAVADGESLSRSVDAGLDARDFMRRSDAYNFFSVLGDAVVTGRTGNNLRDLRILLQE
jgi:glycerate 2-kinase